MDIVQLLQSRGLRPRRTSTNHGGEFVCACPVCGDGGKGQDSDRFHVWPHRPNTSGKCVGRFWCRQCDINGDTIAFLQQIDGLSFVDACAELGIATEQKATARRSRYHGAPTLADTDTVWQPRTYQEPPALWSEQAELLLTDCQERLQASPEPLAWLAARGIDQHTARAYGLGYNQSGRGRDRYRPRAAWGLDERTKDNGQPRRLWIPRGWIIPARNQDGRLVQLRVRRRNEDVASFAANIKYLPVDGSSMATMVLHAHAEVLVVVESGFDAVLIAGMFAGRIGAMTTWNSAARPDAVAHRLLSAAACILGGLDYDHAGDSEQAWWTGQYPRYHRLPALADGLKDPGDAAGAGVDLYGWIVDSLPRPLAIKLGLVSRHRPGVPSAPAPAPVPEPAAAPAPEPAEEPKVFELTLDDGEVVLITDHQPTWQRLADEGHLVFSRNELARLQVALAGLEGEERAAAVRAVLETKRVFGGAYVRAGRRGLVAGV